MSEPAGAAPAATAVPAPGGSPPPASPAPTTDASPKTILGGGPTPPPAVTEKVEPLAADSWLNNVPEKFRADPNLTKYKSFDGFLEGHLNAVKLIGQKGQADRPRDAAEYGWPTTKDAEGKDSPVLAVLKPEDQDAVRKAMFECGVPKGQAPGLLKTLSDLYAKVEQRDTAKFQEHIKTKYNETVEALNSTFGAQWPAKVEAVKELMVRVPELAKFVDEHKGFGVDVDPNLTLALIKIAGEFQESDMVRGMPSDGGTFEAEVARLKASEAFKRNDHPHHDETMKRLENLYATKDPRNRS